MCPFNIIRYAIRNLDNCVTVVKSSTAIHLVGIYIQVIEGAGLVMNFHSF